MTHKLLVEAEERMKRAVDGVRKELTGIRSGKASPALLDSVRVEAYGQVVPLIQVGQVSAPEPRLLVVQPYDRSLVKVVSRAILQADLGLNPTDDGVVVRVPIPSLTEERRRDLVKLVARFCEEGRVHIRQIRHEIIHELKKLGKEGSLPEDEEHRLEADTQKLTDRYILIVDELLKKKTAEVMEV
jgi:ribosome recycling factor